MPCFSVSSILQLYVLPDFQPTVKEPCLMHSKECVLAEYFCGLDHYRLSLLVANLLLSNQCSSSIWYRSVSCPVSHLCVIVFQSVTLQDSQLCTYQDLGTQFFLRPQDVKESKNRSADILCCQMSVI